MTLLAFARLFRRLGAVRALNLDGGGSTTTVVNGKVVNRPSDAGGERAVSSALLILPGPDPDEVTPAPYAPAPQRVAVTAHGIEAAGDGVPVQGAGARDAAALDPGSTGGLLHALSRGRLKKERLPGPLQELVIAFEDAFLRRP